MIATITPQELQDLIRRDKAIELIDVRTPAEFRAVHVGCARNVPLDQLNPGAIGPLTRRAGVSDLPEGRTGPNGVRTIVRGRIHQRV